MNLDGSMKVLLALDDCKMSEAAIEELKSRPWPGDTKFRLISVIEANRDQGFGDARDMATHMADVVLKREKYMDEKVAEVSKIVAKGNVSGKVIQGPVRDTIVREARDWGADLLVMGSHGRRGIKRFLIGSIAESVLAIAPCVVEIVKDPNWIAIASEGDDEGNS